MHLFSDDNLIQCFNQRWKWLGPTVTNEDHYNRVQKYVSVELAVGRECEKSTHTNG